MRSITAMKHGCEFAAWVHRHVRGKISHQDLFPDRLQKPLIGQAHGSVMLKAWYIRHLISGMGPWARCRRRTACPDPASDQGKGAESSFSHMYGRWLCHWET